MIINRGHGPKFVPEKYYDTHRARNDIFLIGFDLNEYHFDRIFIDVHPRFGKAYFLFKYQVFFVGEFMSRQKLRSVTWFYEASWEKKNNAHTSTHNTSRQVDRHKGIVKKGRSWSNSFVKHRICFDILPSRLCADKFLRWSMNFALLQGSNIFQYSFSIYFRNLFTEHRWTCGLIEQKWLTGCSKKKEPWIIKILWQNIVPLYRIFSSFSN